MVKLYFKQRFFVKNAIITTIFMIIIMIGMLVCNYLSGKYLGKKSIAYFN